MTAMDVGARRHRVNDCDTNSQHLQHVGLPSYRASSPLCRPPGREDRHPAGTKNPFPGFSRISSSPCPLHEDRDPAESSSLFPNSPGTTATLTVRRLQGELYPVYMHDEAGSTSWLVQLTYMYIIARCLLDSVNEV